MWLTDTSLTTSHYYFMAFERRVYSRRSHTLMSELPLMLCSTQRPLLRSVCDPSLEFTNTSKCINSAEEERLASQLMLRNAIAEEITGACHDCCLGLSVCAPLWKMLLFSDLSWDIIWWEGRAASVLGINDQRTWFKESRNVSGHPLERVEGCRHTDELMGNLLVMVDSVWISMRASACRCSMTDKVW